MYKLIFILLLACGLHAQAQTKVKLYVSTPLATNVYRGPVATDSALYMVSNCGNPNTVIPPQNVGDFYHVYRGAMIYKDTCSNIVWTSNPDSTWSQLANTNGNSYTIDTSFNLDGTVLLLTIPHGNGSLPDDVRVQVDNTDGLTTFVQPYWDATNVYIPYSIGPICNCEYSIKITP
jgi:hypothetical protein